jgi:hypothetical protein
MQLAAVIFCVGIATSPASAQGQDNRPAPTIYGDEIANELNFRILSAQESGDIERAAGLG